MYQIGWFSTGRGKGSRGLLQTAQDSIKSGELEAKIAFVFCSREYGETEATDIFLKMVEDYQIPLVTFSYQKFKSRVKPSESEPVVTSSPSWRLDYDREVMKQLQDFHPDLCVLAGYMLIVSAKMCQKYDMLNLHPAAPDGPTGTWQEVILKLIENNAKQTGAMMHLATSELDKGPVVTYCTFPIKGEPFDRYWQEIEKLPANSPRRHDAKDSLFKLIRQHGLAREFPLIISTLKAFSECRIKIIEGKIINTEGKPIKGYNLTAEIDNQVTGAIL